MKGPTSKTLNTLQLFVFFLQCWSIDDITAEQIRGSAQNIFEFDHYISKENGMTPFQRLSYTQLNACHY